jgi:hypothetical protein
MLSSFKSLDLFEPNLALDSYYSLNCLGLIMRSDFIKEFFFIRNRRQDWIVILQDCSQVFHVVIKRFLSSAQFFRTIWQMNKISWSTSLGPYVKVYNKLLSEPEPNGHMSSCHHLVFVVCCPSSVIRCFFLSSLEPLGHFFFWPLCCMSFFDLRILITPLVSSNSCFL